MLALLNAPLLSETDVDKYLSLLVVQPAPLTDWPEPNSPLEHILFSASIFITSRDACEPFRRELHRILGTQNYQHLVALLAYIKTCHGWIEAHPEVASEADQRVINHLGALLEEEPALAEFFGNYQERVKHEYQSLAQQLAKLAEYKHQRQQAELKRIVSKTARLQKANKKLKSKEKEHIAELEKINEQLRHEIAELQRIELQLRRKEQELSDFVENGTIGLHWVGPDGIILWANQAELDLLGYTREEYIGHHIAEFHADQAVIGDILQRLTAKETLNDYEARLQTKDGSIKYVLIDSNVFYDEEQFIHTRCFTRDCTVRRQAEQALKQAYNELEIRVTERTQALVKANQLLAEVRQEASKL